MNKNVWFFKTNPLILKNENKFIICTMGDARVHVGKGNGFP